jgi:hypothetical protein
MQLLSELKNTKDINVHPNITFYLLITSIFVSFFVILAFYFKLQYPSEDHSNPGHKSPGFEWLA